MDSLDHSRSSSGASDSISDLRARLRVLQEDTGRLVSLGAKANAAFETHRVELTQLRQKERAVFAVNEDRLRAELHAVLAANQSLMSRLDADRRDREEALKAELLSLRRGNTDQLAALQEELDALREERRAMQAGLLRAEVAHEQAETELVAAMESQVELHRRLQNTKDAVQTAVDDSAISAASASAAAAATDGAVVDCSRSHHSGGSSCPCCGRRGGAAPRTSRTSPQRRPFIPVGPMTSRGRDGGEAPHATAIRACQHCSDYHVAASPTTGGHHRSPHRANVKASGINSSSVSGSPSRRRPPPPPAASVASPAVSHNAPGLLSTIERSNFLRPRGGGVTTTAAAAGASSSGLDGPGNDDSDAALRGRLEGMRRLHLSRRNAERDMSPVMGRPSPFSSPFHRFSSPSLRTPESHHRSAPHAATPLSHPTTTTSSSSSPPTAPVPAPPPAAADAASSPSSSPWQPRSGQALNAACETVLAELAELRDDYADCQRRLRDPHADSLEASRSMRRILAVMDRKADQLRALRSQQRQKESVLRAKDVLAEVMRENQFYGRVYDDTLRLIHP